MPEYIFGKLIKAMNDRKKAVNGAKVLVLGIAYKKNVDDMRESPSVEIMELLRDAGADLAYADPHVPVFPKMREHNFDLSSVELSPKTVAKYDAIVLATDHAKFDYDMIRENAQLIIDSRGIYREIHENIVKA